MAKGSSSGRGDGGGGGIELPSFTSPSKSKAIPQTTTYPSNDNEADLEDVPEYTSTTNDNDSDVKSNVDGLQRHLTNRQIQMIAIGGSIGTALFVSIGYGLIEGGPGNLLLGFTIYSVFLSLVNSCVAEMTVYMPVSGGFVRLGGKWVDEAFGFMAGVNFLVYELALIPFEISALNLVVTFWSDDVPVVAICLACVVLYGAINLFAVKWYGESEFWLSIGKVILIGIVFSFTFITMVGGNPQHDAYGFRYWKNPGAFKEYVASGALGRFEGFLACLYQGAFTIVGPEYLSMVAGETKYPRKYVKSAFKTMYWRFGVFFIVGALCVGIVVPSNDANLAQKLDDGSGSAAASPYVVAMQNMGISVLPHITNALLVTSIFSAGNTYVYASSRTLYGMALEGKAPKFLRRTTKRGVPIYCFCFCALFPLLSLLQLGSNSAQVISWFANLTEAAQLLDYIFMCITYLFFYRALKAQGIDRNTLPYKGWGQPYIAWAGLTLISLTLLTYGYLVFVPGYWSTASFIDFYLMVAVCPVLYVGWKLLKKTKIVKKEECDLVWEKPAIDAYEASFVEVPGGFWGDVRKRLGGKGKGRRGREGDL